MPNQDLSKDSKTSTSGGGFRNLFTKIFPKNSREHDASPPKSSTAGERRAYVPRHANRDMLLAIPAERRSEIQERADETRRQKTMAEIGFSSTRSSMRSGTSTPVRRHSLAASSKTNADYRPSIPRSSSQRPSSMAIGPGTGPWRSPHIDIDTNFKRVEHLDRGPLEGKLPQDGADEWPESYGIASGAVSRQASMSRRTYFSHSAPRGQKASKGKGRATEEEVQAAMLRDRATARAMRNPGMPPAGVTPASALSLPTLKAPDTSSNRWPRPKSSAFGSVGQSLEQLEEEQRSSRPISSIDGSVVTSNADSTRSYANTVASTAATTITDQYSEQGLDRSESEESKNLDSLRAESGPRPKNGKS
jgi:hypothetical protein